MAEVRVSIRSPGLAARVRRWLDAASVRSRVDVELTDAGPSGPDAVWIAIVDRMADGAAQVRRGAVDAVASSDLDRLEVSFALADRAFEHRALRRLFEVSPDAMEIVDGEFRIVDVNPAFESIFGWTRAEVLGRTPGSLMRAGTHDASYYARVERNIAEGRPWTGSHVTRSGGSALSLQEIVVAPLRLGETISGLVALRRDVSRWIEPLPGPAPERIRDHVERSATLPWVLHDADGGILGVNDATVRLLARERSVLVGDRLGSFLAVDPAVWTGVLDRDSPTSVDTALGAVPIELRSSPIRLGEARYVLTVLIDISERKRHERALELARDEAVRSDQAKSMFLANMSHELRTPLNAILGYAELLIDDPHEPDAAGDLARIRRAGLHLLGMVDDILDLSRIESKRLEVHLEDVRVSEVLAEVVDTVRTAATLGANTLRIADADQLRIVTDRRRFAQILLNLLGNACKFTRNGTIELTIDPGPHTVEFVVRDDGPGIPAEVFPRLFDPFERGAAERTHAGTGLGLAISRRLARALGGELWAESPARGAEFVLVIPPDLRRSRG
ncbi:MAG: PAS domain-containing sensor histidine kinase [Myxococcota bacterium]